MVKKSVTKSVFVIGQPEFKGEKAVVPVMKIEVKKKNGEICCVFEAVKELKVKYPEAEIKPEERQEILGKLRQYHCPKNLLVTEDNTVMDWPEFVTEMDANYEEHCVFWKHKNYLDYIETVIYSFLSGKIGAGKMFKTLPKLAELYEPNEAIFDSCRGKETTWSEFYNFIFDGNLDDINQYLEGVKKL